MEIDLVGFTKRLWSIRDCEWSPHGMKMAAIGWIGAHFELDIINYNQYNLAHEIIENASKVRTNELHRNKMEQQQ
jgi:hypothetical protein